ncbi:hypothetical protein ONS95_011013 [Cadophora gregata]|uniref:uncharacterized protein n=1 Tax=Cadophora gregata TaxID=51156 RepID=UPI0026DBFE04|nr:uncharacterized protein ONS95_011013 [Cadophora gregata]KAK0119573.1 hypothetical protein ONS95_011013 [Cadophora gregata]KAK0120609.1 hypothetical protein ONS96_010813 [Cadophora gregata f. sp. sojae]
MFLSNPLSLNLLFLLLLHAASVKTSTLRTAPVAATTADLFNLAYPVVAYPVASDKHDATTYLIACPTGTDTASCEFEQPFTMIEGPKTLHFGFVAPTASSTQTFIFDCALRGRTSMGCTATGVSDDASPSAPITTTEAITYTGETANGFFRSVSLVTDSRLLMTHTPGVLKGAGIYTTGVEETSSERTVKTGSLTRTADSTASKTAGVSLTKTGHSVTKTTNVPSVEVVLSTAIVSPKESEAVASESVLTDAVESSVRTTPFATSSSAATSGTSTAAPASITTSGGRIESASWSLMAVAILPIVVAVGDSIL